MMALEEGFVLDRGSVAFLEIGLLVMRDREIGREETLDGRRVSDRMWPQGR
jgi:hypothetical protein